MNPVHRIAHIIWDMNIGGAERALFQLVREQRRCGMQADIVVCRAAGHYGERARETGAAVVELGQKNTNDMSVRRAATDVLKDYTLVHFHSAEPGMMRIVSSLPGLRRFYTHRSGVFGYGLKQWMRYKIAGHFIRKNFHGISGNTLQGSQAAAGLFGIPVEKIPVTYNGIDFSLLDPKRPRAEVLAELGDDCGDGVVRIGTSANLRPWKRIELLIDAVAALKELPVHCYIIGDGPSRGELEARVERAGIAAMVTFTGRKEHVGDYLQMLDAFVLPSGPEESFGNSAVESMGVGLPTIIFADGGGLTEHVEDGATGYIVRSAGELADRLRELVLSRECREQIGSAARQAVRAKYNLEAMIGRYNSLYENSPLRQ